MDVSDIFITAGYQIIFIINNKLTKGRHGLSCQNLYTDFFFSLHFWIWKLAIKLAARLRRDAENFLSLNLARDCSKCKFIGRKFADFYENYLFYLPCNFYLQRLASGNSKIIWGPIDIFILSCFSSFSGRNSLGAVHFYFIFSLFHDICRTCWSEDWTPQVTSLAWTWL